jgi:hypothetical protein
MVSDDIEFMTDLGLKSSISTLEAERLFYYARGIEDASLKAPVLVLIHGYPQS